MKQCPECNEVFDDQKAFCDLDGAALIDQTEFVREALSRANGPAPASSSSNWITGAIGGLIGVILCVLLYMAFLAPNRQNAQDQRPTQPRETVPARSAQVAAAPLTQPVAAETATPTASESPAEAEASPTQSPEKPASTPVPPAALNNGPIATGGKSPSTGERAIIKMKDGTSVEADAAWEDSQGVWFRRSGLVSFVEKSRVEAITEPPQRRPAPADAKAP